MTRPAALLAAAFLAAPASAQFIGPVPPAPEATPAYVRPATPPPRGNDPAPESAPIAPSIVARDAAGRLIPVPSPEEAAVGKYPFDEAQRAKVRRSLDARRRDLDRFVANHLEQVARVRESMPRLQGAESYPPLFEARDALKAITYSERPLDRLQRDGAITPLQRTRLDAAVREYQDARAAQVSADAGGDAARQGLLTLRQTVADSTREPLDSLDRQLSGVATMLPGLADGMTLSEDDRVVLAAIGAGVGRVDPTAADADARRADAVLAEWPRLTVGTRKGLLLRRLERTEPKDAPPAPAPGAPRR
jgi:hypothetical protein